MKRRHPHDHLPLKRSTFNVLLALGEEEHHGYGIMRTLSDRTGGQETLLPGTLYAALARMVDEGLVEELSVVENDKSEGPKRRYYRATQLGRAVARAEAERLAVLLRLAADQNFLPGSAG